MRRASLMTLAAALCLFAQTSRDAYRNAYKEWRQADPNLERDAVSTGGQLDARTRKVSADAAQYEAARKAFLDQMAAENRRKFAWLESPVAGPPLPLTADSIAFVNVESKSVKHNMDTFAGDPDPGIQQLRGMLQRESATLALLSSAITDRAKAADAAATAGAGLERTRGLALADDHDLTSGWTDAASETDREAAAWVDYYQLLSKGAQGVAPPAAVPSAPAPIAASAEPAPRIVEPAPPPKPAITAVPLIRYTGAWTFPASNGLYHGPQPEFADLVVHEDNGHATGTLFARFKAAAATDPVLRFDFSGEFTNQRTQAFQLETSDGSKGMLELIPGPAFNLIEVNFQIESKPGKVRQANMVLVKK